MRPLLIGICGGSASGKSRLAGFLKDGLGADAVVVCQDWYYKDHSHRTPRQCEKLNFDHPSAIEHSLMLRQLKDLKRGKAVRAPIYNYASHTRAKKTRAVAPAPVIVIDGLFVLCERRVRAQLDLSVFIDVPADERLLRRVRRDSVERRVNLGETLRLYESYVRPMHDKFIGPSGARATWRWLQLEDDRFKRELLRDVRVRLEKRRS